MRILNDSIAFVFCDSSNSKGFDNVSNGGIVFSSYEHDTKSHRWGKVTCIGPDCNDVKVGDEILIENLRWTDGHVVDGEKIWFTNEKEVMGIKVA
jgi:co-chaperonin GroES (HSP10)